MPVQENLRKPNALAPTLGGMAAGFIASGEAWGAVAGAIGGFGVWFAVEKVDLPGSLGAWQRQVRGRLPSEETSNEQ